MPNKKTVQVNATLGQTFKMESRIRDHVLYIDQAKGAGGTDSGPSALEYLLLSMAGCIGSIARIVAHQKKVALRGMELEAEGTVDVDFLLGKSTENRCGFESITVRAKLDADLSAEEKEEFLHEVDKRCPVSENLANTTPIKVELAD